MYKVVVAVEKRMSNDTWPKIVKNQMIEIIVKTTYGYY